MHGERISSVMRGTAPCAYCEERHTACHGNCEKYNDWKAETQKVKNARNAYYDERNMIYEEEKRRKKWDITHS